MKTSRKTCPHLSWASTILASVVLILISPGVARADDCTDAPPAGLGGIVVGGECQVNSSVVAQGVYNIPETLHICGFPTTCVPAGTGTITVPPLGGGNSLTILITGSLVMDIGSAIVGDVNTATGVGASILVTATQNVFLAGDGTNGAKITSNLTAGSCAGGRSGNIAINSGGQIFTQAASVISAGDLAASLAKGGGNKAACPGGIVRLFACVVDVDGKVLSQSALSGTGAVQRPGGGPITIVGECFTTVSSTGIVSSRGHDAGADLVHVQGGCQVRILGLVESTGPGHAVPNSPKNHCDDVLRPDKPANSTACVEIWSGGPLEINSNAPFNGEVNADTAQFGGHQIAWIDVFASSLVDIAGDTTGPYAIHANQFVSNSDGGIITVKSQQSQVSVAGLAIQANGGTGPGNGGRGGSVDIESLANTAFLLNASVQAKGDTLGGGHQGGGTILAHSWGANVVGVASANVDAGGGPPPGSVTFRACNIISYLGNSTPAFVPFIGAGECGAVPFPPYASPLPQCFCVDANRPNGGIITCIPN